MVEVWGSPRQLLVPWGVPTEGTAGDGGEASSPQAVRNLGLSCLGRWGATEG